MKMVATSSMKLAIAVVVLLAVTLPSALANGSGGWKEAYITYYGSANGGGTQGGACGYQNTNSLGYGFMTAALSSVLYQGGGACGACFQLKCAPVRASRTAKNWCWSYSRSITVTATNLCPPGSRGGWCNWPRSHFDLPMPAFLSLARREGGVAPVYYKRVACAKRGGVRFTMGGNPFFLMILIHNVGGAGDIKAVKIKGEYSNWVSMYRNYGALWTCRTKLTGALSFQITAGDGRVLYTKNAVGRSWKFGQVWEGGNFGRY